MDVLTGDLFWYSVLVCNAHSSFPIHGQWGKDGFEVLQGCTNVDLLAKLTPHPSKEQMIQSMSHIYWIRLRLKTKNVVATKIILVTYLMLLNEKLIRVTFSIKTNLYTCLKSFNLLGIFQCESGILWCWQNLHVACQEHSHDMFWIRMSKSRVGLQYTVQAEWLHSAE